MLFKMTELKYQPNPVLARALDVLFILHADHEQNCSTSAMRNIGSSHVDPYSALAGAAAALYGPLHGGANEAVLRMLNEIGSVAKVPEFIKRVKSGEANTRLMGFGHRVYKSYDPRAKVIKRIADLVFTVTGKNPLLEIALELERIALQDEYFVTRKLYPERRLLLGPDLPGDGLPGRDVPGAVRHPAHGRLDRAVGRDAARSRAEDRAAAADLHRRRARATTCRATSDREDGMRLGSEPMLDVRCSASRAPASLSGRRPPPGVRLEPRLGAPAPARRARAAAGGLAGHRAVAQVHQGPARRAPASPSPSRRGTTRRPLGRVRMVNLIATIPGAAQGSHRHRRPLRHEAVPRVPVRRRQRRRIERGVPDRAGARAEGAPEPADDRAAVSRRRGSGRRMGRATDHTYGSRHYVDGGEAERHARRRSRRSSSST